MDGLQPVARIGQRALGDGGERIGEIALVQRLAQFDDLDASSLKPGESRVSHASPLSAEFAANKPDQAAFARERGDQRRARLAAISSPCGSSTCRARK